ncbi:hypothetical protein EBU99_11205 [bacterium]|nr:hypothetical protein [bacterium]
MIPNVVKMQEGSEGTAAGQTFAKLNIPSLVIGLIGFGVSLYALILHIKSKTSSASLNCDVNDVVNCSKVVGGEYGELFSIPLGAFGMSYFGIVMAMAILPAFLSASPSWIARRQLIVATIGSLVSLVLAYISYFKIGAVCIVCSTVHGLTIVNFFITLMAFLKVRSIPQVVGEGGFIKLLAAGLALGVPPLLAGALLPLVMSTLGNSTPAPVQEQKPTAEATPFPSEWVQVARSNYVGKGEDYRLGNDQAKVVVHMFSDLQCPHCKVSAEDISAALSAVGSDRVLFVYRNYPLSNKCNPNVGSEGHAHACDLAMALRCAGSQRKEAFWEFKEWAFSGIEMSPDEQQKQFSQAGLVAQAQKLKLDSSRFEACLRDKVELPKIQDDIEIGKKMGLTGTPLIVINGRTYSGERSPQGFTRAFREALEAK